MSQTLTADEVRTKNIAAMGGELGELYSILSNELTWLFWRWSQFVALYSAKPSRLDILNAAAPFFFYVIQDTLWYDTILGITRLAGPAATGGKQNLSVHRLPDLIADPTLGQEVQSLLDGLSSVAAFATDWRNRHIAHRDLDVALGRSAKPLPAATKKGIDTALDKLADVLNAVDRHYFSSTTSYRLSPTTGDAEGLLYVLRDGLKLEELRMKRLEAGEYKSDDWNDSSSAV